MTVFLIGSLIVLLLFGIIAACKRDTTDPANAGPALPYRLDAPDATFDLPEELSEISGLAMSSDGRHLLAVNDEEGTVFLLHPETGALESSRVFGKKGDYEGIEMVGSDIFAVKSNGTLVRIPETGDTSIYATHLNEENDVEGLGYDSTRNCLMLACKGKSGKGDVLKGKKAVYAFDLATLRLNETPAYVIDRDEIGRLKGAGAGFWENLLGIFSSGDDARAFGPSGLAFSPLDNNLYIIASVGKVLVVLNPDGKIIRVEKLDPDRFKQPEGLCFDRSGRLYISSEGGKHQGRIFRFSPRDGQRVD